MELVQLKNNEKLVATFNEEENLIETFKSATEYPPLRELAKETCTFRKLLRLRVSIFNDEVLEERVSHTIVGRNLESQLKLMVSR